MNIKEIEIENVFKILNKNNILFMVLRGSDEIPDNVTYINDLDLLCSYKNRRLLIDIFKNLDYKHYQDSYCLNEYLYFAKPHDHFSSKKKDLHFDIVYNLSYRSPNNGEWVSVDANIQNKIWVRRKSVNKYWKHQPSDIDEYVHIVCHAIFDKKYFKNKYIKKLEELYPLIDKNELLTMFNLIFFKYSKLLINQLNLKNYENIIENYLEFKKY